VSSMAQPGYTMRMLQNIETARHQPFSVSVVIPAYNRLPVLDRAFQSVKNQTYPIKELILIDDGSTDATSAWVSANCSSVKVIHLSTNRGAAIARNAGVQAAGGDLIAFLDSDDFWLPTYISKQVAAISADYSAVFTYCSQYRSSSKSYNFGVKCRPADDNDLLKSMLLCCFIHTMSQVVVRRSAFERVGLFNEQLPMCEDWELYLRLLTLGKPAHLDEELVVKNWRSDSLAFRDDGDAWLRGFYKGLDLFYANPASAPYADLRPVIESSIRKQVAKSLLIFRACVLGQELPIEERRLLEI
jgi:glycosyltransferase involved in cell wall biosynthesis